MLEFNLVSCRFQLQLMQIILFFLIDQTLYLDWNRPLAYYRPGGVRMPSTLDSDKRIPTFNYPSPTTRYGAANYPAGLSDAAMMPSLAADWHRKILEAAGRRRYGYYGYDGGFYGRKKYFPIATASTTATATTTTPMPISSSTTTSRMTTMTKTMMTMMMNYMRSRPQIGLDRIEMDALSNSDKDYIIAYLTMLNWNLRRNCQCNSNDKMPQEPPPPPKSINDFSRSILAGRKRNKPIATKTAHFPDQGIRILAV